MFAGAAPKCYVYSVKDRNTGEISNKVEFKVKGISLNCRNLEVINPRQILRSILQHPDQELKVTNPAKIGRSVKTGTLFTRAEVKTWRLSFDKRIVDWLNYTTLPYGFRPERA